MCALLSQAEQAEMKLVLTIMVSMILVYVPMVNSNLLLLLLS